MNDHWLCRWEQEEVVRDLLGFDCDLIKWSDTYEFPLKKGGFTDIYVNLRNARMHPDALRYISNLYCLVLLKMQSRQFVEVPDSMSCFAPIISTSLGIPYATIRSIPKENHTRVIGSLEKNINTGIIDDVITDGESKRIPYLELRSMGIDPKILVLVDREQGWNKRFIKDEVWSGMTLHRLREILVGLGKLSVGNKSEEKNKIILALDGKPWKEVLELISPLRTSGVILKINDLLFDQDFDGSIIKALQVYTNRVMVDLKGHDIPNTLVNICNRIRKYNPWAVTVHCSGGIEMLKKVKETFRGTSTKVFGVTVLTSLNDQDCNDIYSSPSRSLCVNGLASMAKDFVDGFVCSPNEVRELKNLYPDKLFITPGIRKEVSSEDQKSTATYREAIENGSDYLVIGREITKSQDPLKKIKEIQQEI